MNRNKGKSNKGNSFCSSPILIISWLLLLIWVFFLIYCWKSGLIDQKKFNSIVQEVDLVINNTENTLLRGAHNLHFPTSLNGHHPLNEPIHSVALPPPSEDDVYIIFSTDCTPYQDWQTLVLFHSAKLVKQKGTVTRIASGCDEAKQKQLTDMYEKLYFGRYHAHFTPDFKNDAKTNKKYDFYNKPWGLKHWLENANPPIPDNAVIALLDPDMIFVRPITPQILNQPYIISKRIPKDEIIERIHDGHPVAQTYGLGAPWTNDNHKYFKRGKICGEGSPCLLPTQPYGELHYSVGPPYVATKHDFIAIAQSWTTFVPRVYEDYPFLLAEMYAYSMASAHENLPHLQVDHYMVSNVEAGGEGWDWVDTLDQVCIPPVDDIYYPNQPMPSVVHFCQTYHAGDYLFTKRRVPKDIFSCESPLFVDLPTDLAHAEYFYKKKKNEMKKEEMKSAKLAKRNAYMICIIHDAINKALVDYKQHFCSIEQVNYEKTINLLKM